MENNRKKITLVSLIREEEEGPSHKSLMNSLNEKCLNEFMN